MVDFDYFGTVCRSPVLQFGLRLRDGVPGVVFRVVLLICTVIRDAADDFFLVVSSREGALRVGPIALGLSECFWRTA